MADHGHEKLLYIWDTRFFQKALRLYTLSDMSAMEGTGGRDNVGMVQNVEGTV